MAELTETERSAIRMYLGWPERYFQQHLALQQAMNALDMTTEEARTQCRSMLSALADIDVRLTDSLLRNKASKVGSITLNPREIGMLRAEGRRWASRLSALLGVWVENDSFAGGGGANSVQDNWVSWGS